MRPFETRDTSQVVALWNACLPYDPVSQEKLLGLCQAPHYGPAGVLVAEHGDRIVGFLPAMAHTDGRYPDTGWILSLVVDGEYETTEVGDRLLEGATSYLRARGRTTIAVANFRGFRVFPHFDARHRYPIALLERHGFERLRELVDVSGSLVDSETPLWAVEAEKRLGEQGIGFDYCHPPYRRRFLSFVDEHF